MKRKIIPVLIGCTLSFSTLTAQPTAERYVVSFPEGAHVNYAGASASVFSNGLPVGIGSGLPFTSRQDDALTFATITDRGPSTDSPKEGKNETKIFVMPGFAPLLMTIRIRNGKAEAIDPRSLHDDKGAINGLSLANDVIGSTNKVTFSGTLHGLKGDNRGLDTGGITPDGKGGYWLYDEYGPFLININSKGKIQATHGPQAAEGEKATAGGLPNILRWRQASCGFKGLARMPDGRIIVAARSALDVDTESKKKTLLTRLVSFDPASGKTAIYGYPIDSTAYSKNSDAKIGGIVALGNQHILLIEQEGDRNNKMRNLIYEVDLNKVSDLSGFDEPGEYPKFDDEKTLSQRGITLTQKTQVVDLHSLGWQQEKVEGLALIDNKTLAMADDNDFSVKMAMQHSVGGKTFKGYRVSMKGKLTLGDKQVETTLRVKPLGKPESGSKLWIMTLPEALK